MKTWIVLLTLLLMGGSPAAGYVPVPPKGAVIPEKTPARRIMRTKPYLQNPAADGMTVMWLTRVPCVSWVEYGTDTLSMQRAVALDDGLMPSGRIHRIRLEGLRPGIRYYYRACSREVRFYSSYYKAFGDTVRSRFGTLRTWNDGPGDFNIVIFNDIHKRMGTYERLCSLVRGERFDLAVFNGDCFNDCEKESHVVDAIAGYSAGFGGDSIPAVYLRGNHELRGAMSLRLWDYLEKMNGALYTAFTYGDTRFVVLDTGEDKPDGADIYYGLNDFSALRAAQADFLKRELASPQFRKAARRVLIHHIPIYGRVAGKYNPCRELWHPLLRRAPFDLSVNGHQHAFRYVPRGADGNNFPVLIGGGYKPEDATVTILKKSGKSLHVKVLGYDGQILLDQEL